MKYAIRVRDYIYTAPMLRLGKKREIAPPRLMVSSYELCAFDDYAEAAEYVLEMRVTFSRVGFNRDYWLVPVEEA